MIKKKTILLIILTLSLLLVFTPITIAQDKEDEELEERLELIQASQNLMKEKRVIDPKTHKLAAVFTTYGEGDTVINTGLRVAPQLATPGGMPLRFMGELFYLRQDDELAGFLSLTIEPTPSIYLGAGGEVTDTADYQVFAGWNITENIFIEARAINSGGSFSDSEVVPVAGFQFSF
ncbi:hypothetical protein DFR79_1182 [Halanaerobium saccharolyticum]|uniref:Uncharacterized protein n=1 Tax=Halanaerobium saccharolyticum TaxID=43595 RepID=A0A4V3CE71_9FIRM|nr:hypothetical protein [Halanaerobium saccharolyticum]TDO85237.1 hypothetical protein DFR79_1182 [Halanaerobium saccharolyticum]